MIKPTILVAASTLSVGAFALPTLQFTGVGKGLNSKWTLDGGSNFKSTFAGELGALLTTNAGTNNLFGFCTSPTVTMQGSGSWEVTVGDTSLLSPNGARIANLVNTYAPAIRSTGDDSEAAAMQLSIWELLTETSDSYSLSSGNFQAFKTDGSALDANVLSYATTYLSLGGTSVAPFYKSGLNGAGAQASQDLVTPVPEPATWIVTGLGFAAIFGYRRNKRSR